MTRRARSFIPLPIAQPAHQTGGAPAETEADHFVKCPTCCHMIDMRNPAEAFEHDDEDHLPPLPS